MLPDIAPSGPPEPLNAEERFIKDNPNALPPQVTVNETSDLVDARFMSHPNQDADGQITGYTVQYIELYEDSNSTVTGRVLDVGHYKERDVANESYQALQGSITDGSITLDEVLFLAEGMAESNGLASGNWRAATTVDHLRYQIQQHGVDGGDRDLLPEDAGVPIDSNVMAIAENDPDPRSAADMALVAMQEIGLEVTDAFNLDRDAFYEPGRGSHFINGVFQMDLADPARNCRPMLVALTPGDDRLSYKAQAVEFGRAGSLENVQEDHDLVQSALEQDGLMAALDVIGNIEIARLERTAPAPEIQDWAGGDIA